MLSQHDKFVHMLEIQDNVNCHIKEDWREMNRPWYRAIWTECAELMDHHGWKWWKQQQPNQDQIHLEIVDIWHFVLSDVLNSQPSIEVSASFLADTYDERYVPDWSFLEQVEELAGHCLEMHRVHPQEFFALMHLTYMDLDVLYTKYIGKSVLNKFRQDYGYKDGSYIKTWDGREDNEHLTEIVASMDADASGFEHELYLLLAARYPNVEAT